MSDRTVRVPEEEYRALYRLYIEVRSYVRTLDGGEKAAERRARAARSLVVVRGVLDAYETVRRAQDAAAAALSAALEAIDSSKEQPSGIDGCPAAENR